MAIRVDCSCGKKLAVKEEHAGKRLKCPACNAVLAIPRQHSAMSSASARPSHDPPSAAPSPPPDERITREDESREKAAAHPGASRTGLSYKACPSCAEQIIDTAKKCKHCGEWMDDGDGGPSPGLQAISGLGPFGENHIGLILMPDRFIFVNGKHGSAHVGVALISMAICALFCFPVAVIMLIFVLPFDLTVFKRRRERVWSAFERGDLAELPRHGSYCKSFPLTAITIAHFSEAKDKIYIKADRLRIKVKCSAADRRSFQAFANRCRSVSGAADTTFFSIP